MSAKSSFLPRLSLSRGDGPILPLHSSTITSVRKKPSEYDMSDLSPKPDDALLFSSEPVKRRKSPSPRRRRSPSPSPMFEDHTSYADSTSKPKTNQRPLFAGPPPPIAASRFLYRDEEDKDTSLASSRSLGAASIAHGISSIFFDRRSSSPNHTRDRDYDHKPDAVWLNLQRRERALQKDLQRLLDAQSAGLAAHLDPNAPPTSSAGSDAGGSSIAPSTTTTTTSPPRRHVTFHSTGTAPSGALLPVRQPRPNKPPSLRSARAGLTRTIALLADLKADEDAQLTAALGVRKQALSQLRRLTARRAGITEEMRVLEADDGEEGMLGRELRGLIAERDVVGGEIAELEGRLAELRKKKGWLDGRVEEVRNRREAGLSGYRGALSEVEGRIKGILGRPGVRPLDGAVGFGGGLEKGEGGGSWEGQWEREGGDSLAQTLWGVEFLSLRPERRTAEMAREWWEGEVGILERRKGEVDRERAALEEGVEVWKGAVKMVTEFEAGLRREMGGDGGGDTGPKSDDIKGKGKTKENNPTPSPPSTPEQAMYAQLDKMRAVMSDLEDRLRLAEEMGWNLLICAIGAELEAFRQAETMLRDALRAAGFDLPEDEADQTEAGSTQYMSATLGNSRLSLAGDAGSGGGGGGNLVDLHEAGDEDKAAESDNEVPPDLLVAAEDEGSGLASPPPLSRESSASNEVPIEFLVEHRPDSDYSGFRA